MSTRLNQVQIEKLLKNRKYWSRRLTGIDKLIYDKSDQVNKLIDGAFKSLTRAFTKELDKFYNQFADLEHLTKGEALRLLNSDELKAFHMSVDEYVQKMETLDPDEVDEELVKELKEASLKYRVTRLEALELQMQALAAWHQRGISNALGEYLKWAYPEQYYRTQFELFRIIGLGTSFERLDDRLIEKVVNTPWVGADNLIFSQRFQKNNRELAFKLAQCLTNGLSQGLSYTKLTENVMKQLRVTQQRAMAMVVTETTHVITQARLDLYTDWGCEKAEICAVLDSLTCKTCQALDLEPIDLTKALVGLNIPPFHVNCRCTIVPLFEDINQLPEELQPKRAARSLKTGKVIRIPRSWNFERWLESEKAA